MEYDANGNIIGFEIIEDKEELLIFEKMVEQIWNDYDDDGNGFLDYNEAKSFAREFMLGLDENNIFCENKFKLTFELVDEDKSGTIDKTEMASFIRQLKAMQIEGNFTSKTKPCLPHNFSPAKVQESLPKEIEAIDVSHEIGEVCCEA